MICLDDLFSSSIVLQLKELLLLLEDAFTFIGRNFSSSESDEFLIWWRKFRPTNSFARHSVAQQGRFPKKNKKNNSLIETLMFLLLKNHYK